MKCPDRATLRRFLDELLPAEVRREIEAHVEGCAPCQTTMQSMAREAEESTRPLGQAERWEESGRGSDPDAAEVAADSLAGTADGLDLRNYELLGQLGKGGMGEVYRCADPSLGRDLAIKVMGSKYGGDPQAERRFVREARVTGSLQHPGIVPVHNLGRLPDGRLYYTMKLVRGQTLAGWLANSPATRGERLTELLVIFEKVCQAVAYAHSKRVIHRDLKPANVMVGRFGEVQIMDWGLAKLLSPQDSAGESTPPAEAGGTVIRTEAEGRPVELSLAGAELGTPAYMPPEQAGGDVELMDERADVFALGAILCVILTGQPPYSQPDGREALRRAKRADLAEALSWLDGCGADAELVALCKKCLEPEREARPHDAGVVAERVAAYRAGVEERLRRAELERAEAQVKAREERKRRRVEVGLAAAVLLLVVGVGVGVWWQQQREAEKRQAVEAGLDKVAELRHQEHFKEARLVLDQTRSRLGGGGPADLRQRLQRESDNLALVDQLDKIRLNAATWSADVSGTGGFDYVSADRKYTKAFWEAGIASEGEDPALVAARVRDSEVKKQLLDALDDWARVTRDKDRRAWLLATARQVDPDEQRNRLRDPELWEKPAVLKQKVDEGGVAGLPPPLAVALGARLVELREARGVRLLTEAQRRHPKDFWLAFLLGNALREAGKPVEAAGLYRVALALRTETAVWNGLGLALADMGRAEEATDCYLQAIEIDRTYAPAHINLGNLVKKKGHLEKAIQHYKTAIENDPNNATAHSNLSFALFEKKQVDEAVKHGQKAVDLDPENANAHNHLGAALQAKQKFDEAIAHYERALKIKPEFAEAHSNLGNALADKGQLDEAIAHYKRAIALDLRIAAVYYNLAITLLEKHDERLVDDAIRNCKKAIEIEPENPIAHCVLGAALVEKGQLDEAVRYSMKAIKIKPKLAEAHGILGDALMKKGQPDKAIEEYREAIAIKPNLAEAYANLANALLAKGEVDQAIVQCQKAIKIDPDSAKAYYNLGRALMAKNKDLVDRAIEHFQRAMLQNHRKTSHQ